MRKLRKLSSFRKSQLDIGSITILDVVINVALFFVLVMELAALYYFAFKIFMKFL